MFLSKIPHSIKASQTLIACRIKTTMYSSLTFTLVTCLVLTRAATDSNPNLNACNLTAYRDDDLLNTRYGPFTCGDYSSENGDFDDNQIDSAKFISYNNFNCYAYFFEDQFSDTVLLMNATEYNNYSQVYNSFDNHHEGDTLSSIKIRYENALRDSKNW